MTKASFPLLALCLLFFSAGSLTAQELFTVRVGSFRDVKQTDFADLAARGFVYGAPRADNVTDVYLGNYSTEARATEVADQLRSGQFRNAQVMPLPTAGGQPVVAIQIRYQPGNSPLDWNALERAGELYVESVDGVNKIMTGIYPSIEVANTFLPSIKQLGYTDAFVKRVNNVRLIPVGTFETGIKKPLIPIELQQRPAVAQPQPTAPAPSGPTTYSTPAPAPPPASPTPTPATTPAAEATPTRPAAAAPPALPAAATAPNLPTINGRRKSSAAAELQRVLKEKGFYTGSIDGLYGAGTTAAYRDAWDNLDEIRKYRLLTGALFAPLGGDRNTVTAWPEVSVTLRIAEDLAAGMANADRARQLAQQRADLYGATQSLSPAAASRVRAWSSTVWGNLNEWAGEDPLHAQIVSALRVAYHQSHVRLENMYADRGIGTNESRDLATALLQNLVGAQLDRFL